MATSDLIIRPYNTTVDQPAVSTLWRDVLPQYPVYPKHLEQLLALPWGSHFVALVPNATPDTTADTSLLSHRIIGFCATYANPSLSKTAEATTTTNETGHLPVIIIHPDFQSKGYGTQLLQQALDFLWKKSYHKVNVGYSMPRFWGGVPADLNYAFLAKRGFREDAKCKDLYQPLSTFRAPQYILDRAASGGLRFEPLTSSGYDECINAIQSNFPQWAGGYKSLHAQGLDDEIMVAFSNKHEDGSTKSKQVGWTLMLSPGRSMLWGGFAFLPVAGGEDGVSGTGKTALIAAVGVSPDVRGKGVGLGLMCAAMEEMKRRGGIEGVFIDSVKLEDFYEKIGFRVWRDYTEFAIENY